jgi:thymidylate kinase
LQTANYLFVQLWVDPDPAQIREFLKLVPLPDVAVYVHEDESTLIERIVKRGHKRIPDRSQHLAARFIERALFTFDRIASDARVQQRLLIVDGRAGCVAAAAAPAEAEVARVLEIIRAGMTAGAACTVE